MGDNFRLIELVGQNWWYVEYYYYLLGHYTINTCQNFILITRLYQ